MTGLALLARPLIVLMITDKWLPCVEYMRLLCFAFMLYPIHALNLNLLQVKGRSDWFLRLEIIKKGMMLALLVAAIPFGVRGICIGGIISSVLAWVLNTYYTGKLIRVGFWRQVADLLPVMGYTAAMGVCVYLVRNLAGSDAAELLWGTLAGVVSYLAVTLACRAREWREVAKMLRRE